MQITEAMIEAGAAVLKDCGVHGGPKSAARACLEAAIRAGQEEEAKAAGLTPRMKECLDFIRACIENGGISPSFGEIAEAMGLASRGGVARLVESLEQRGFIKRTPGHARTIILTNGGAS